MDEFLFYKVGRRRSRTESLHDLLVVAKNELKRTKIMHEANLSWRSMTELLKFAEDAGLIEEVAVLQYERYGRKKPAIVWKTTEKGLKYAKNIYDNSKRLQEAENK